MKKVISERVDAEIVRRRVDSLHHRIELLSEVYQDTEIIRALGLLDATQIGCPATYDMVNVVCQRLNIALTYCPIIQMETITSLLESAEDILADMPLPYVVKRASKKGGVA